MVIYMHRYLVGIKDIKEDLLKKHAGNKTINRINVTRTPIVLRLIDRGISIYSTEVDSYTLHAGLLLYFQSMTYWIFGH